MLSAAVPANDHYFDALRRREFARLDAHDHAYLDYTGSALYGASQVEAQTRLLADGIFGNPHSEHTPSRGSSALIETARRAVLAYFDVDESTHAVCFIANASAAIKLVAESYPFSPKRGLMLSADNHNSVNGIREYAHRAGAPVQVLPLDTTLRLDEPEARLAQATRCGAGLLAFPMQSNFSGVKHPQALVANAQELGWDVLLDAAAFVASNPLSLHRCPAQFTAISFYKMFGLPTGLGALIARRDALAILQRPWFAGGTVEYASVQHGRHQLRAGEEGFEDGTPNFLGMGSVIAGLNFLTEIGGARIALRTRELTRIFLHGLRAQTHANGAPLARIYGPGGSDDAGATLTFNVLRADGRVVPYAEFEQRARTAGVALRGGCFCNPGAAEAAFGFDAAATARCFDAAASDFSIPRFSACLGSDTAVGALRASFGIPTNNRDIARALEVVASFAHSKAQSRVQFTPHADQRFR
ncbi:aminotransferase class V-fold PLP-dependent enzyme [Pseudolysobacter antarcticus]|uniref:Aminotransferase class V-fold PLP-dependent enzyme n=1 Tax=Pseudolysobacter antarcticus TaxID=2511995 RepID=A0A411HKR6_9GAMM|nr:aminotransferase class V-fold PLP-dependent enzyme [Pseudolysobacter antarcticus]QBB71088.1 aminotransferase class V-fold PLP-dependent enzyme [Pseudolysobacter antarcticus]